MLFKFTSFDVENTSIIDCLTGDVIYHVSTPRPCTRSRSRSTTSLRSFASFGSSSQEKLVSEQRVTSLIDRDGAVVAEIFWEERHPSVIRIGDETLAGTAELFDAAFVKVLPDETFIPTRMEYIWRTTFDSLTLLDDDHDLIGTYHPDCSSPALVPSLKPGTGHDYLELEERSQEELPELLISYLLIHTLRERMYAIAKYVYGQQAKAQQNLSPARNPFSNLRRQATRSIANLRDSWRRVVT
ncbi:hypothetical protein K474DRAFT_414096 [Panus rudis PR-1116 ss-1]|nr:hypothetical protein K474DRAFT_414096 [Panus rudis PR-1116 ss-1]